MIIYDFVGHKDMLYGFSTFLYKKNNDRSNGVHMGQAEINDDIWSCLAVM